MVIKRPGSGIMGSGNKNGPLNEEFERLVTGKMEQWHVPGIAVAVVDGDKTYSQGYGIASMPDVPVMPSTLFYAGSTTKAFTAALMSLLVEDNENYPQVQWKTPIHQLIPDDFALENEYATNHTTIEDALSHRSGLPRHDQAYGTNSSGDKATVQHIIQSMRHLPLTAEPRTKYQYSNLMFVVAAHVIETVTGRKFGDLLREQILKPLGMDSTFSSLEDAKSSKDGLARGYYYSNGKCHEVGWMEVDQCLGDGNVISNVLDYAKWARAITDKTTPLSADALEELFYPRTIMPFEEPYLTSRMYSLGWRTGVYHGHRFYEHTGGMNAFGAELILFPDKKYSVVAFGNTAGTSNFVEQVLAFQLIDDKLGVPMEERYDWNKQHTSKVSQGKYVAQHAKSIYFPTLPSPTLPTTLPLASYAGTYYHPGYQNLTISFDISSESLQADRSSSTNSEYMNFEHVSGEHFLVRANVSGDLNELFPQIYPVEFRIGANGKVKQVGIRWEPEMGEEKIWLERVDSE
ncbi:putative penicillin-binding protein [Xylogone sp. PMI_703]|nr:putative penicillin-binding protein [Xylogone sp. PMI_703]